jgi:hypothetical protein
MDKMDELIDQLRHASFEMGIKYAMLWLLQNGVSSNAPDFADACARDGLMFLETSERSAQITTKPVGGNA